MEMVHFIPPEQRRLAMQASQADTAPVLISGASGTGKGAIARWIHINGPRSARPCVAAKADKSLNEQIAQAQGGTLVISEIGKWPRTEQKNLLNFLLTKAIPHPKDSNLKMIANARIIATTSQNIEGRVQGGLFDNDLLLKLNVFRIEMPDLCNRTEDFEDISLGILNEITGELHREYIRGFSTEAWNDLKMYQWPGNIRELRNVLRVSVIKCKGDFIDKGDLPELGSSAIDFQATREEFEKIYIIELLKTFHWQIDKTCRISRINKAALMAKIKHYGIELSSP